MRTDICDMTGMFLGIMLMHLTVSCTFELSLVTLLVISLNI